MTAFIIANNVNTTLGAPASSSATTLTLASSANLPTLGTGQQMPLTLNDAATGLVYEIVYVTAISGATLTVLRGQEGTTAQNWSVGDYAACMHTAQTTASINGSALQTFEAAPAVDPTEVVNLGQFAASLGINGYQKLPSGLIMQLVSANSVANSANTTVAFPIAFPNGFLGDTALAGGYALVAGSAASKTTRTYAIYNPATGGALTTSVPFSAIVWGY